MCDVIVPNLGKKQMPGTKYSSGHAGKFPPDRGCGHRRGRAVPGAMGRTPRSPVQPVQQGTAAGQVVARPAKHRRTNSGEWPGCGDRCLRACCCPCAGQRAGWDGGRQTRPGCRQVPAAGERHRSGGRGSCQCAGGSAGAQSGRGQVTPLENCRPGSASQLGRSPRDHARLRRALATGCRRTLGAGDGAFEVPHVQQPDGDDFHRAG